MKWKLLLIVGVLSVSFMSVVIWRTDQIVYADRITWVESQARTQVMAINKAIEAEVRSLNRLASSVSVDALKLDKNLWRNLNPHFAVASALVGPQGQLQIQNFVAKEKSAAQAWTPESLEKWLTGIKSSRAKVGDVLVRPITDSGKNRFVAAIVFEAEGAKLFISGNEFLLSLVDPHKGGLGQVMIVSDDGTIVSHSTSEYVGTRAVDDPVVQEFKKTGSPQGVGEYPTEEGNIFGYFERARGTNLYTVMSATQAMIANGRKIQALQFLMIGLGLILVSFAAVLMVTTPYERGFKKLTAHMSALLKSESVQVDASLPRELHEIDELIRTVEVKGAMLGPESLAKKQNAVFAATDASDTQVSKMQAYKQIAEALGHEMKSPLIAVLGYAQVIESLSQEKMNAGEIQKLASQLLVEARSARTVMEKLFSFAGGLNESSREILVDVPVRNTLAKLDSYLKEHSVELKLDIAPALPKLSLAPDALMKAIEAIVVNSVQAMERMPKKQLKITVQSADMNSADIEIQDTGEGISAENLSKVFDPFFTTRSYAHHLGMGLSMAYGVIKEHGGSVSVQSNQAVSSNRGTTIKIHLPQMNKKKEDNVVNIPESILPVTNETLEKHYVEKSEEIQEQLRHSDSPLQVDIGAFLELPPEIPANLETQTDSAKAGHSKTEASKSETSRAEASAFESAIDSAFEDKTQVIADETTASAFAEPVKPKMPNIEFSRELDKDELTFIDGFLDDQIDKTIVANVTAPTSAPLNRASKLDAFQVEVRKPGTRL